jgi:tRNA(Ile)-lysidine synthase
MDLISEFERFIKVENLFQKKDRLLLAVSGGLDSVVLCELCAQSGYDFVIAHCNFQLRGEESHRDEQFVRSLAQKYDKPVLVKAFDTEAYAKENKCSIQVAAREMRYTWFYELVNGAERWKSAEPRAASHEQQQPNSKSRSFETTNREPQTSNPPTSNLQPALSAAEGPILTAHHLDDNIETMLMNFFKGTGMAGLRGMLPKQGKIARPLLFAHKEQLKQFAVANQLAWVDDSSNEKDIYSRNYIRHKLLPLAEQLYPQVFSNLAANLQRFREMESLYRTAVDQQLEKLVERKGEELHIPVLKLKKIKAARSVLFELLQPLGFSSRQMDDVIRLMESETGKYTASATHRVLKNRNWLIIAPAENRDVSHILIETGETTVAFPLGTLTLRLRSGLPQTTNPKPQTTNNKQQTVAQLDADNITFPLILRKWKPGDYFYPLGMHKKKKVSRFLIDLKLSAADKEKVWVVEMNKKLLWVMGLRIDNRFRITEHTRQILQLEWEPLTDRG